MWCCMRMIYYAKLDYDKCVIIECAQENKTQTSPNAGEDGLLRVVQPRPRHVIIRWIDPFEKGGCQLSMFKVGLVSSYSF